MLWTERDSPERGSGPLSTGYVECWCGLAMKGWGTGRTGKLEITTWIWFVFPAATLFGVSSRMFAVQSWRASKEHKSWSGKSGPRTAVGQLLSWQLSEQILRWKWTFWESKFASNNRAVLPDSCHMDLRSNHACTIYWLCECRSVIRLSVCFPCKILIMYPPSRIAVRRALNNMQVNHPAPCSAHSHSSYGHPHPPSLLL